MVRFEKSIPTLAQNAPDANISISLPHTGDMVRRMPCAASPAVIAGAASSGRSMSEATANAIASPSISASAPESAQPITLPKM